MSDFYNKDWYSMSDMAILKDLSEFIKQLRLKKNYTQSSLAEKAGIHRITLSEFEHGTRSVSLTTFIHLLRALNELELLDAFKPRPTISPLQMVKLEGKKRQRASSVKKRNPVTKKLPTLSKNRKKK
jgi:putative transcriptional regulator